MSTSLPGDTANSTPNHANHVDNHPEEGSAGTWALSPPHRRKMDGVHQDNQQDIDRTEKVEIPHNPNTHSKFFNLPREIRDELYHRAFDGSHQTIKWRDLRISSWYNKEYTLPAVGLPKWLLTNRQILKEGLEQFHRAADFRICTSQDMFWHTPETYQLLDPIRVQHISIGSTSYLLWGRITRQGKYVFTLKLDNETTISVKKVARHLMRSDNTTRDVTFAFHLFLYPHSLAPITRHIESCEADFSVLECLGTTYERIEFTITSQPRVQDLESRGVAQVTEGVNQEASRVGTVLVGGLSKERCWQSTELDSTGSEVFRMHIEIKRAG